MSERYGLPYMGSKNDIASWICNRLTHGGTLYDVFAGGCAITHYAMLHKMYDRYVVNDVNPICQLFKDAVDGKYKNETEWISREKFEQRKKDDMYVRQCWSFGNKGNAYLYSYLKEPWKKALHYLYLLHDDSLMKDMGIEIPRECISDKSLCRRWIISHENYCRNKYVAWLGDKSVDMTESDKQYVLQSLERLERLQSLESLERLERLQSLESLERLEIHCGDYRDVAITDSVGCIYCDPPYRDTARYHDKNMRDINDFDYEGFYDWCCNQKLPVYISEYHMPTDRFRRIANYKKSSKLKNGNSWNDDKVEGLWIPINQKCNIDEDYIQTTIFDYL